MRSGAIPSIWFRPAGRELRYDIDHQLLQDDMDPLLAWCGKVAAFVKKRELRE